MVGHARDAHLNLVESSRRLFEVDPGAEIEGGGGWMFGAGRATHPVISNAAFRREDGGLKNVYPTGWPPIGSPPSEEARGRGLGWSVTAAAVSAGFEMGAELASLQASPMSESLYRRMGFETIYDYRLHLCPQPGGRE